MEAEIGKQYRHYKNGKTYTVIGIARHSETFEELVIYRAEYENEYGFGSLWVRPRTLFETFVEHEGERVPRFSRIV